LLKIVGIGRILSIRIKEYGHIKQFQDLKNIKGIKKIKIKNIDEYFTN